MQGRRVESLVSACTWLKRSIHVLILFIVNLGIALLIRAVSQ
jgi:hypothetical protein